MFAVKPILFAPLLAAILFLLCGQTFAETLRADLQDGITVQLSDTPCKNGKVLKAVDLMFAGSGKVPPKLSEGWAEFPGQSRRHGCWVVNLRMEVVLVYEDGSAGVIPLIAFSPVPGGPRI